MLRMQAGARQAGGRNVPVIALRPPSTDSPTVTHDVTIGRISFPFTCDTNLPTQRYIHDILAAGLKYEIESTLAIIAALNPGETFFDIGANCGWFSAVASQCVRESGLVVAFEPDSVNCARLIQNAPRAQVIQAVVSDKAGQTTLYRNLDNDGGHSLWPCGLHQFNQQTRAAENPKRTVRAVTLDDFLPLAPSVIKCDTEGAEWHVITGASQILANPSLRMVILEKHDLGLDLLGHNAGEVEAIMRGHGFTARELGDAGIQNWIFER